MTHTDWNTDITSRKRKRRDDRRDAGPTIGRRLRFRLVIAPFALVLAAFPSAIRAADEQSGPFLFVSSTRTPKDIEIEAKIRRALRQDAQLRPLNLGVHVSGGIAKLSGPVPAAELKQQACTIAGHVIGVLTVNAKELYLSTTEQDDKRLTVRIQDDPPTQTRAASPLTPSPGGGRRVEGGGLSSPSTLHPPPSARSSAPAVRVPQAGRLTANPHPASPAVSIAAAIENLRRREARYQQINARVRDTTVYLFAGDAASEDAMTFAQAVRRLPGVQHVILSSDPR